MPNRVKCNMICILVIISITSKKKFIRKITLALFMEAVHSGATAATFPFSYLELNIGQSVVSCRVTCASLDLGQ